MLCNVQFITINENYLNIHYKPKYKFKFYLIIKKNYNYNSKSKCRKIQKIFINIQIYGLSSDSNYKFKIICVRDQTIIINIIFLLRWQNIIMSVEVFVVIFRFHCKFPIIPCKFLYMFINLLVFCPNFRHVQVIVLRSE